MGELLKHRQEADIAMHKGISNSSWAFKTLLLGYLLHGLRKGFSKRNYRKDGEDSGVTCCGSRLDTSIALVQISELAYILWHMRGTFSDRCMPFFLEKTPLSRYTGYMTKKSKVYKYFTSALMIIDSSELIIEMLTVKFMKGEKAPIMTVSVAEIAKFIMRLGLLISSGCRTVLTVPIREPVASVKYWRGELTGRLYPAPSVDMTALIEARIMDAGLANPGALVKVISGKVERGAEILYHARFLVYLGLQMKWGRKSWAPWVTGLAIEVATFIISTWHYHDNNIVMHTEHMHRLVGVLEYVWRMPFIEDVLYPTIDSMTRVAGLVPPLYPLADIITAHMQLYKKYVSKSLRG